MCIDISSVIKSKRAELDSLRLKVSGLESDIKALERAQTLLNTEMIKTECKHEFSSAFELVETFCKEYKTSVTALFKTIGISPSVYTRWKEGKKPLMKTVAVLANGMDELSSHQYRAEYVIEIFKRSFADMGGAE